MAEQKERKPWQEMTYQELDEDALFEHAVSLGKEKGGKALDYLEKLKQSRIPFTAEMRVKERERLARKKKRKKDKATKKMVDTDTPLYTPEQIEKILDEIKDVPKYSTLALKKEYCTEYYPEILPKAGKPKGPTFEDKLAAARAKLQQG